jgi:hypothetical protein
MLRKVDIGSEFLQSLKRLNSGARQAPPFIDKAKSP